MKRIMIVEDDQTICKELKNLLEHSGYVVNILNNFSNSFEEIINSNADLVLLDINIPFLNGETLLREVRKKTNIPIIMVTSRVSELDEVLSMSYGADDYITKPYNPTILLLRIQNVLRRMEQKVDSYKYRELEFFPSKGILKKNEEEIELTKNEMIVFSYLLNNQGKIVTRDVLMTDLWNNDEYINDNALTVNISRLRSKLSELGYCNVIETRKGQGYILL
ncbi:MAG: response regulator transcription factor [Bacilli bacterium]|nr:response regulator transcription factor [Bacilli bacterium]